MLSPMYPAAQMPSASTATQTSCLSSLMHAPASARTPTCLCATASARMSARLHASAYLYAPASTRVSARLHTAAPAGMHAPVPTHLSTRMPPCL